MKQVLSPEKTIRLKAILRLHDSLNCDTLLDTSITGLSNNKHMRELKKDLEKQIIEEIHPYKIYHGNDAKEQWITYLPDLKNEGKRKKLRRTTYEELCKALIEFYRDQYHLDMTMEELFQDWARFRRDETSAKPGTVRKDVGLWKKYISTAAPDGKQIGRMRVTDITTKLLYQYFRSLTKDREHTHQAVTNIRSILNGMLGYAVEREIIASNPVRDVDIKRLSFKPTQSRPDDVYSYEEAQKLLDYLRTLEDDPFVLAIRLDFNLFARIGEISGLKWENVDLEKRSICICNQITYEPQMNDDLTFSGKKMVTENYLKGCTDQGYRSEYITDDALEVLKKARTINPDGEFVFMPFGKPIVTLTFNKRLKKYCGEAGVPYHSSHKIRFYTASMAYNGENLAQISRMMGHSQVSTTLHYLRDAKQNEDCSELFKKLGAQRGSNFNDN